MMLDLFELWDNIKKNTGSAAITGNGIYPTSTKPVALNFEKNTRQSSIEFDESPDVVFVKNTSDFTPVNYYAELDTLDLSEEEEKIRQLVISEEKKNNPKFYDGEQMLIAKALHDKNENIVFLVAKKVPYSVIVGLNKNKFPRLCKLNLSKCGVLSPLITTNGETTLHQRSADSLFSVHGGFLEPQGEEKQLNFEGKDNIVLATARSELIEEIAGVKGKGQNDLAFEVSVPKISAVSFRASDRSRIGTIEFIAPSYPNINSAILENVIKNNRAKDRHEHTDEYKIVPIDSERRDELLMLLLGREKLPGGALILPCLLSLAKIFNQRSMQELPRGISFSESVAFPIRFFYSHTEIPKRLISSDATEQESQKQDSRLHQQPR